MATVSKERLRRASHKRGRKPAVQVGIDFTREEANLLRAAGFSDPVISRLRCGGRRPSRDEALRIHVLTKRPLLQLLYGDANIEQRLAGGKGNV